MAVKHRHTDTLAGDHRACSRNDLAVFHLTPDPQRLFLALFFFAAYVRNHILHHLRPVLECLTSPGDCLIGGSHYLIRLKFLPGRQHRRIALNRTVGLYGDETSGGAQTFTLRLDHLEMLRINLRNYHRHIRRPAVRAVVGNNRRLRLRILFLDLPDLLFRHIHRGKDEIYLSRHFRYFIDILDNDIPDRFRHRCGHLPSAAHSLLICFACRPGAGRDRRHLKPGMIFQQGDKPLSNHTCSAQNTYF